MDDINKSTVEEPLKYFQWMFVGTGFFQFKHKILLRKTLDFEEELKKELAVEFNMFLRNLDKALDLIALQDKSPTSFLSRLHEKATKILLTSKSKRKWITTVFEPVVKEYPFVENTLLNILQHIEKEQQAIQPELSKTKTLIPEDIPSQAEYTKSDLIDDLFGFLKDEYISATEWEYLISYLKSFVIEYKIPHINKVLSLDKKKRPIVKYLFYKLYSNLLNSRGHLDDFSQFYLIVFETLTPTEDKIKTVSKKLATEPQNLPNNFPKVNKGI
ncbi:MAG: hypothetical protein ACK5KL_13865 [Dysgonomonas sp.]